MPPPSRENTNRRRASNSRSHSKSNKHSHSSNRHPINSGARLMSLKYLLNPSTDARTSRNGDGVSVTPPTTAASSPVSSPTPSPPLSPARKLLVQKRKMQSEKKRQWRKNLTQEQRERRQMLDAQRKREQRMNQTNEQRSQARQKDAARKAAKRMFVKREKQLNAQVAQQQHEFSRDSPKPNYRHSSGDAHALRHAIDDMLNR